MYTDHMSTPNSTPDLLSTGRMAEILQAAPSRIDAAARRAGARPLLCLDGRRFYDGAALEGIRAELFQGTKQKRGSK